MSKSSRSVNSPQGACRKVNGGKVHASNKKCQNQWPFAQNIEPITKYLIIYDASPENLNFAAMR